MLTINKKNISFTRGDTVNLVFNITDMNGVPYVLPVLQESDLNNPNIGIYIGFVIRTSIEDKIVYENYLDIKASKIPLIQINTSNWQRTGSIQIAPFRFCDFKTQNIPVIKTNYTDLLNKLNSSIFSIIKADFDDENRCFIKYGENLISEYNFNISFQINPNDTTNLDTQRYVYDIALYIGEIREPTLDNGFPLENIAFKQTLLNRHNLTVEDNVND